MFIKVFVPNANGKIELTVQELEALLKDAANKAVSEQCGKCYKNCSWWSNTGNTLLNNPVKEIDFLFLVSKTSCFCARDGL